MYTAKLTVAQGPGAEGNFVSSSTEPPTNRQSIDDVIEISSDEDEQPQMLKRTSDRQAAVTFWRKVSSILDRHPWIHL